MDSIAETSAPWYRSTLAIALAGSLLLWAALPPVGAGWLAWIAPVPWLWLVRQEKLPGRRRRWVPLALPVLSGRSTSGLITRRCGSSEHTGGASGTPQVGRPYGALWVAGFVFWLLAIHWLRLPHPAVYFGWLALSAYLAFYLPVFVGLSRVAVHRVGVPLWLAAPVVWTGLELARSHLLTGFLMGSLAHTQVRWPAVIQISDLVGEYGVDFLVMMVAACITCVVFPPRQPWAMAPTGVVLAAAIFYGHWRLAELERPASTGGDRQSVRIALIQGNSEPEWKFDPEREREIMDDYVRLSERAIALAKEREGRPVDLVVWPETMFRTGLRTFDAAYELPQTVGPTKEEIAAFGPRDLASLVRRLGTPVLVGIDRAHFRAANVVDAEKLSPLVYNSAVLVDREGKIVGTYDKVHRVMFGEYIPFADWLPFLYRLTPLTGGINAGERPVVMELGGWRFAPSICYETVIPHVMRRQSATLVAGAPPDVLVNLTNDAWYWGSSELDMHLACGVFRAVETRTPLVIAANGGISAWIDRSGRTHAQSPRRAADVILADIERGAGRSPYVALGDWFAGACLTACVVLAIIGFVDRRNVNKTRRQGDKETRR